MREAGPQGGGKARGSIYARFAGFHKGKPIYGKDHVASLCSHEGDEFSVEDEWWEPAVEVLPAAPADGGD